MLSAGESEETESKCLAMMIEQLHIALKRLESEAAEEDLDLNGKKTYNLLIQITTQLLEIPVQACDALDRWIVKMEDFLRASKVPEVLPLLLPLLTAAQREQQEASLLTDMLADLTAALGIINKEESIEDSQTCFHVINPSSGHNALSMICIHLTSRFKCTEHSLKRARDLTEALNLAVSDHKQRIEREHKDLYKSIVLRLCQLTNWTSSAAKLRCTFGADSDRVLGVCIRMYTLLGSFIKTLDPEMAHFIRPEVENLLRLTGKKLSSVTGNLITYVGQATIEEQTASKVSRLTKLNPRLVLEQEQFFKHVIVLEHKAKINLHQYLPMESSRDFKIDKVMLNVNAENSDEDEIEHDDSGHIDDVARKENVSENEESDSDSEEEVSTAKRRKVL